MDAFSKDATVRSTQTQRFEDKFVVGNGIRLHYLERAGKKGPLVLLHGLSANAHCFDELLNSGLSAAYRTLALDLRGRGLSEKPANGYTFEEHANDVIAFLDALGLQDVILIGHSFGGFLATFVAWRYSSRVRKLVLLDIAASALRDPRVGEMLKPSLGRLSRSWNSRLEYINDMKAAPFLSDWWTPALERYYQTDVEVADDGRVRCLTLPDAVAESARAGAQLDWPEMFAQVSQPVLLLHAVDRFGPEGATPLVLPEQARTTANVVPNCRAAPVEGNHITMLFGSAASSIAASIAAFVEAEETA